MESMKQDKLVELRRRTDQDLVTLLTNDLDRALRSIGQATSRESRVYRQAAGAHRKARRVAGTLSTAGERQQIAPLLEALGHALQRIPSQSAERQAVCSSTA